jgi:fibronectin-binding autotransporter adhesin
MSIIKDFIVKQGVAVQGTAAAVSTVTGALQVAGGAGLGGSLFVAGTGTFGVISGQSGTGSTGSVAIQTLQVKNGGFNISGDSYLGGKLAVNGQAFVTDYTPSSSTATGALQVYGGAGIWQNLYVGGNGYIQNSIIITAATLGNYGVSALYAGTDTTVNANTGSVTVWSTATLASVSQRSGPGFAAGATPQAITILNTTQSTTTGTGALIVWGGAGFTGNIFAGGLIQTGASLYVATTASFNSTLDATTINTGSVTLQGGLAVAKTIYATSEVLVGSNASTAVTATNALAITVGGLGVAGSGLFGGAVVINSGLNSINTNSNQALLVAGGVGVGGQLSAGKLSSADTTVATSGGSGSLQVYGGAYIAQNLVVMSNSASTGTTSSNAVYVKGGVGIDGSLLVGGNTTFAGSVTFNGTATYVYSTNTFYTDNIIELHTPPGGVQNLWNVDDGKDIGLRFHYYANSTDTNAALVLDNSSKELHWYSSGAESLVGDFATASFGIFKTGIVALTTVTNSTNATSGALQVAGGIGVGKNIYVTGTGQTASSSTVNLQALLVNSNGIGVTGDSYFANNVGIGGGYGINVTNNGQFGGWVSAAGGTGSTSSVSAQGLRSSTGGLGVTGDSYIGGALNVTGITYHTNSTQATSTNSGALQVTGGVGVGGNIWIGGTAYVNGAGVITTATLGNYGLAALYAGTDTTVNSNTGSVTIWSTATFATVSQRGGWGYNAGVTPQAITIINTTQSTTTGTGALIVWGGAGFTGNVNIGGGVTATTAAFYSLTDNVSTTVTNGAVQIQGGVGIAKGVVIGGTLTNYGPHLVLASTQATTTGTGALIVSGGAGIGNSLYVGSTATILGTNASVSTNTGALVVAGGVGLNGSLYVGNTATILSTTQATATGTGALVVIGGASVGNSLYVGSTATIVGKNQSYSTGSGALSVAGGVGIGNALYVGSTATILGNDTSASTGTGALVVAGGVGIGGNLRTGDTITAGVALAGTPVIGLVSNNSSVVTYTSNALNAASTGTAQNIDVWSSSTYRSAKYNIQIVDTGFTPNRVHFTEMVLIHDGAANVYKSEYGITTNVGELGTFDANMTANGVQVTFLPNWPTLTAPSALVIKAFRTTFS